MKLVITTSELLGLVTEHVGRGITEVEVVDDNSQPSKPEKQLNQVQKELMRLVTHVAESGGKHNRIAVIKEIRGLTGCGLAEGKAFLELMERGQFSIERAKAYIKDYAEKAPVMYFMEKNGS